MADGDVKIVITGDDSDIEKKLSETEEGLDGLGEKQKETQKETEKTTTKFEELANAIDRQEKELKDLKGEYIETAINLGENSKEAQNLKEKFASLNTELKENKARYQSAVDSLGDLEDSSKKSGKGFSLLDGVMSTFVGTSLNDLGGKLLEVVGNLVALADETREYREDMAKLDAGFKSAGHSTETAQKAYDGFYKLLGESDRSVEAVNHLAELTTNTEEVAKWTDIAAGVTAKFGDSLPIEGLTEAANETAKVGAVTGPLADALNWAGISEDAFNEKLAACNSEQERATLITNTLSTEYAAAAAEYNTLTASTQAAREATNNMEKAQAALGAAIEPVTTAWTSMKATALTWLAEGLTPIIEKTTGLKQETDLLTASNLSHVAAAQAEAAAYRETVAAASELAAQQMADVDYATNTLLPQLQALVDSNGNVKKGYEERATFIMGQLNEAYGTEYTRISEIVGKNGELTQSIQGAINAKKAQILLEAHEEDYIQAVQKKAEAERAYFDLMGEIVNRTAEVEKKEEELESLRKDQYDAFQARNSVEANAIKRKADQLEMTVNAEKAGIDSLTKQYNQSAADYELYSTRITDYDTAKTLILEGNTEEAISYLNNLQTSHDETASAAEEADNKELASLENKLKNSAIKLALIKEEHAKNYAGMTKEQQKEIDARLAAAEKEVSDLGTEAKKLGSSLVEGIGTGADGKSDWLSGKLGGIVSKAIEAAKKIGLINSPSKKTRDVIGKPLAQGVGVGIEEEEGKPIKAAENLIVHTLDAMKKEADIHSPAGETEYIGEMLGEGMAVGIDGTTPEAREAVRDMMKAVADELESGLEEEKETVKTYNYDLRQAIKKHNDDLWEENHQSNIAYEKLLAEHNAKIAEINEAADKKIAEANADTKKSAEERNKIISEANKEREKQILAENASYMEKDKAQIEKHNAAVIKLDETLQAARVEAWGKTSDLIQSQMQAILDHEKAYTEKTEELWRTLDENITTLQDEYQANLESRAQSIRDSMNLWDFASINNVRGNDLKKALQSQVEVLETYNADIASLANRGIFSTEMLDSIKKMGVEAAAEVSALNRLTDKELTEYAELWGKKNELAMETATAELATEKEGMLAEIETLKTQAVQDYVELREEYQTQGALLAAELKQSMVDAGYEGLGELADQVDDYTAAGGDLLDGVIEGITLKSPGLAQAVSEAVRNAINAAKTEALDAHSPSRVTKKELGFTMGDGVIAGWTEKMDTAKKIMAEKLSNTVSHIKATVSAENARMAQGVGVRDMGIGEVVRAVGMQTAGINSLASEYRRGSSAQVTIPLILDGREVGHAFVDLGNAENARTGTSIAFA